MEQDARPLLVIGGPTATGKPRLGVLLARQLDGEIVSADSMQIYQGMDVGTAKPTPEERQGIAHHMLDLVPPEEPYSAARYAAEAAAAVEDIRRRGRLPIVVGGTGQYIRALLSGEDFPARTDPALRRRLLEDWQRQGGEAMHARLREIDPAAAARRHPRDRSRVLRALEIWETTGKTPTETYAAQQKRPPRYPAVFLGLSFADRADLRRRIDERVCEMFRRGLWEEARALYDRRLPPTATAAQAIGYKELFACFAGEKTREEACAEIALRSRQYAKRQLTWFRHVEGINWILWEREPDFTRAIQISTEIYNPRAVP